MANGSSINEENNSIGGPRGWTDPLPPPPPPSLPSRSFHSLTSSTHTHHRSHPPLPLTSASDPTPPLSHTPTHTPHSTSQHNTHTTTRTLVSTTFYTCFRATLLGDDNLKSHWYRQPVAAERRALLVSSFANGAGCVGPSLPSIGARGQLQEASGLTTSSPSIALAEP